MYIYIYSFVRNEVEESKTNRDVGSLRKAQLTITLNTALLRYVAGCLFDHFALTFTFFYHVLS